MASDGKNPTVSPQPLLSTASSGLRAEVRAKEAMEILRRRERRVIRPDVLSDEEGGEGEAQVVEASWSPHWTDSPSEATDNTILPTPDENSPPQPGHQVTQNETDSGTQGGVDAPKRHLSSEDDPRFETLDDPRIPGGQMSFRIGEVARIVGVKPHVLRFWENEFDWVEPEKTRTNQRRYRRGDVVRLLQIRRLRHDAKLTVAQTRASIETAIKTGKKAQTLLVERPNHRSPVLSTTEAGRTELVRRLADMRRDVVELLEIVEDDESRT